ncbi:MAG: TRAP transporter small permease subunit [Deltaproteobacteria bacterium]|nr:MAG: TRAP transporter small permease subunit [Deltaproteobacteria bacterium]
MTAFFARLDRAVYRAERALVVAGLVVMSAVVFLDVVHRTAADPDGLLVRWLSGDGARGGDVAASTRTAATILGFLLWWGIFAFALRSRSSDKSMSLRRAAGVGALLTAAGYVLVRGIVVLFPNGFIWSQPFALVLLLWVGFVGASMCTYEDKHLRVEAVERYLPDAARRPVAVVRNLLTAAFLIFLVVASWKYVVFHYEEWVATEHLGGMFLGTKVPRWTGFAVLPLSFGIMAARFVGRAVQAARGTLQTRDAVAELVAGRRTAGEGAS